MSASPEAVSARPAERPPAWENLPYDSQGRPCGRPPAALRPGNDATVTGEPASPSARESRSSPEDTPTRNVSRFGTLRSFYAQLRMASSCWRAKLAIARLVGSVVEGGGLLCHALVTDPCQ